MNELKSLFSKSFESTTIEKLENELKQLYDELSDEFYIIMNDYKNNLRFNENGNVYDKNQQRQLKATLNNLTTNLNTSSIEYKILYEVMIIYKMIESVEQHLLNHISNFEALFTLFGSQNYKPNDESKTSPSHFTIAYNKKSEIEIIPGIRDLTLTSILLTLYLNRDISDWANDFFIHIDNLYKPDNEPKSANPIHGLYFKFHSIIHILNDNYNLNNIKLEFAIISVFSLLRASYLLFNNYSTDFINIDELMSETEKKCSIIRSGIIPTFSNIVCCSIYVFNSKYDWFNLDQFDNYIKFYGNTLRTLSIFIIDREKYNSLYALGSLYALRYANISLSNNMWSNVVQLSPQELSLSSFASSNRALLFMTHDKQIHDKISYYVLEVQDRVFYASNTKNAINESIDSQNINEQVMNNNQNVVNSFIVYNISNHKPNNIDVICYSIDELRTLLYKYRDGEKIPSQYINTNIKNLNLQTPSVLTLNPSYSSFILKLALFLTTIFIIVMIIYLTWNQPEVIPSVYDKSLY